jgi:acyl carrier protein
MSKGDIVRSTILELLPQGRGRSILKDGSVDPSIKLLEVGLIDSTRLLDIILEVETRCGVEFNPSSIDFETGVTLGGLISAFDPAGA